MIGTSEFSRVFKRQTFALCSKMSYFEELKSQFEVVNASDIDPKVLQKCEDLCITYSIDPEDFIDQWLAYSASNSHGLTPTLEILDRLERYELKKAPKSSVTNTPQANRTNVGTPVRTPVRQNLQKEMMESPVKPLDESISHTLPSENFSKRNDSGSVLQTFGNYGDSFKQRSSKGVVIKVHNGDLKKNKYMYEKFLSKRGALNEISRWVITEICHHYKLEPSEQRIKQYSGEMVICGRIYTDTSGKMDQNSIMLEGLVELYKGQMIKLSLNKVEKVRLFNGQSVVISGNNMKDWFTVKEIFTKAPLLPLPNPEDLKENLQIFVASGPFTLQENLLYEPLEQLLKQVADSKPNVLILMGPFLDRSHPHFEEFPDCYDSFFESIVDGIMHRLQGTGVEVVLVPSHKDIHSHVIFPSLPYILKKRHQHLHLLPDPFFLDLDGLIIRGSTADILFHLSKVEFCKGNYEDRIGQIVSHIFNQRSFYPLHPPDLDIRVDYQLVEQVGMFENSPHIMILPSNFKHFVKTVEGCVVINPERMAKGNGGSFAKIEVKATPKDQKITERISCLIQRV